MTYSKTTKSDLNSLDSYNLKFEIVALGTLAPKKKYNNIKKLDINRQKFILSASVADPVHFFGSGSGSADPVFKIRIRLTPKRPDPTGSGSFLVMFLMFSKINNFVMVFLYQI